MRKKKDPLKMYGELIDPATQGASYLGIPAWQKLTIRHCSEGKLDNQGVRVCVRKKM